MQKGVDCTLPSPNHLWLKHYCSA